MGTKYLIGFVCAFVSCVLVRGELAELDCPDDCDCHYFRINWVTDCSESNLTEIPAPEDGLSLNVYILNMNGNELKNITPFPSDIKLRRLQLADNQLTKITQDDFAGLSYLLDLDLSGNSISTIDPESFRDSRGLITLEMQMNPLDHVEGPFLVSRSILYLYLSDCKISKINLHFFQNTTSINKLDLSGNPLETLDEGPFDPLVSLEHLKLNRCKLTYISETTFFHNVHIKTLELAENHLKGPISWVQVLGGLSVLEHLDLRNSEISNLPEDVFGNNTWLRSLVLAENELTDLDVATTLGQNLRHLHYVDLSNCRLTSPLSEDTFANATDLRTLLLSGNHLSASGLSVALTPLTKLQKLALRNCSLTRLPADTFHRFTCLQELDISRNPLNDAFTALLSPLESLERLDMGYSSLEHISKSTFSKMTSLKSLILSGNPLTILESGLFQNLTNLESLELNYCGLSKLNSTVFPDNFTYPDLEELHLAGNPLEVPTNGPLLPRQLSRLRTLDLSDCNLTFIPEEALNSFKNISRLLLAGNNLSSVSQESFAFLQNLPLLESLDLSRNNLTDIEPKALSSNREISAIRLIDNPWQCGCHIADMWEWAVKNKGDVGVLIGSTTQPEDIAAGGKKKKKGLLCYLDPKIAPIQKDLPFKRPGRREYVDNVYRTWARFVRESSCPSSVRLRPARLLSNRQVRDLSRKIEQQKEMEINEFAFGWIMTVVGLATLSLVASVVLIVLALLRVKTRKLSRTTDRPYASESVTIPEDKTYIMSTSEHNLRRLTK